MFLLDTNVVSELRKAGDGKADRNVAAWFSGLDAARCYISVITLMELEIGVLAVERRDRGQAAPLRAWLGGRVAREFSERTRADRCGRRAAVRPPACSGSTLGLRCPEA